MSCSECKEKEGTIYITCSAHKHRIQVCVDCWSKRENRDVCCELDCNRPIHVVQKNRVFRSWDYFKQKWNYTLQAVFFILGFLGIYALLFLPLSVFVGEPEESEKGHDISIYMCFFLFFHFFIYLMYLLLVVMFMYVERFVHKDIQIFNVVKQYNLLPLMGSIYVSELLFCLIFYFAPERKQEMVQVIVFYFFIMDMIHLFILRHPLRNTLWDAWKEINNWFMEEQEEHLFLTDNT